MYYRKKRYQNPYLQKQLSSRIRELKNIYPIGHSFVENTNSKKLVEFC